MLISWGLTGCATHHSLRKNTLSTAATLGDINCQQVLDNVARFAVNADALPSLAVVNNGTVIVTDQGSIAGAGTYAPTLSHALQIGGFPIVSLFATPNVSRNLAETWSVAPVTDADKLRRIRCAFQLLVRGNVEGCSCRDCRSRLNEFFQHDPEAMECLLPVGWFQIGLQKDVPNDACYVSNYCDKWIWVCPDGLDGLAQFTMSIMDMAMHSLDVHTKVVVRKYNAEEVLESTEVTTQEVDQETGKKRKVRSIDRLRGAVEPEESPTITAPQVSTLTPRGTALSPKQARKRGDLSPVMLPKFE